MKLDHRLPLGIGSIIIVILIIIKMTLENSFIESWNYKEVLMVIAQILATIFAITISLTIIVFQYFTEGLTPRILALFMKKNIIIFLLLIYSVSISLIIFFAEYPNYFDPNLTSFVSFLILILCLSYLISYLFYLVKMMQPYVIIEELVTRYSDEYYIEMLKAQDIKKESDLYKDNNFIEIEQTLIKAVRNNDYHSFSQGIDLVTQKIVSILNNIKLVPNDNENELSFASNFFLGMAKRIYYEITKEKNGVLLDNYSNMISRVILFSKDTNDLFFLHFEEIGKYMINNNNFNAMFGTYFNFLYQIINKEYQSRQVEFFLTPKVISKLKFVSELAITGANNKQERAITYAQDCLSEILMLSIKDEPKYSEENNEEIELHDGYPYYLIIGDILSHLKVIHNVSCDNGIDARFFGTHNYTGIIKSLGDKDVNKERAENITNYFCDACKYSAEKGLYGGLDSLTSIGMGFFFEYYDLAKVIIDKIFDLFSILWVNRKKEKISDEVYALVHLLWNIWRNIDEAFICYQQYKESELDNMEIIKDKIEKGCQKYGIKLWYEFLEYD